MQTIKFFFLILPLTVMGFASCRECNKCRRIGAAEEIWLCREDFGTVQEYNDAVALTEADGYDCDDYSK